MKRIVVLLFFAISCIEPIDVDIQGEGSNILVVEGGITTGPGPHTIQLTRTAKYGSIFDGTIQFESNALVSIRDNIGTIVFLEEIRPGVYATDERFRGEVGKSYSIQIETEDGEVYNSLPEEIISVVPINKLYAEFKELETADPNIVESGMQVNLEYNDPPEELNYYYWRYKGTYQINARPDLNIDLETGLVSPLDCCNACWTTESNTLPNVQDDNEFNGKKVELPVAFIQDDGVRFRTKYHIVVEQRSLSAEAYQFYQLVNQQISIDGDIFDPPPATIRGNLINLNNPDANVVGYFSAADITTDTLVIYKDDLDYVKESLIRGDCRNYKSNASIEIPEYW